MEFLDRMVEENDELVKKIDKLESFLATDKFKDLGRPNRDLLMEQFFHMRSYKRVLDLRIVLNTPTTGGQ